MRPVACCQGIVSGSRVKWWFQVPAYSSSYQPAGNGILVSSISKRSILYYRQLQVASYRRACYLESLLYLLNCQWSLVVHRRNLAECHFARLQFGHHRMIRSQTSFRQNSVCLLGTGLLQASNINVLKKIGGLALLARNSMTKCLKRPENQKIRSADRQSAIQQSWYFYCTCYWRQYSAQCLVDTVARSLC